MKSGKNLFFGLIFIVFLSLTACNNQPPTYTIQFETYEGSFVSSLETTKESSFNLPETELEGYTFEGWYLDEAFEMAFDIDTFLEEDTPESITLYAKFETVTPDVFTVTFESNITFSLAPMTIEENQILEIPAFESPKGYMFEGFYTDSTYTETFNFNAPITEDVTIYILFEELPVVFTDLIEIELSETSFRVNESYEINVSTSPLEANVTGATLTSLDENIASIENGVITFHDLGVVTLEAISLDLNTTHTVTLSAMTYGIKNQADLDLFIERYETGTVYLLNDTESLVIRNALVLETDTYHIDTVFIESEASGTIELRGLGVIKDLLSVDAKHMTVINEVNVVGDTHIERVSLSSFISEGSHQGSILISGGGRIELKGKASSTPIEVNSAEKVILDGQMTGKITVDNDDSDVLIDGQIESIEVLSNAKITVREGAEVSDLKTTNSAIDVNLEKNAVLNVNETSNVTVKNVYRVYIEGYAIDSELGYLSIEEGTRLDMIPTSPLKEGHTFRGWFLDESHLNPFSLSTAINDNLTVYAWFEINTFDVSFNGTNITLDNQTINYNAQVIRPETPEREGHTFRGWYVDRAFETPYNFNTPVKEDLTLYGQWEINTYQVSFNNTSIDAQTINYNERISRPLDPTQEGYTFNGWFLDPSFETLFNFTTRLQENITLYPKFEINTYEVRFNTNVNDLSVPTQTVSYNTRATRPQTLERDFYLLEGWYLDSNLTQAFNFGTPVTENLTLYAKWMENTNSSVFPVHFMNLPWDTILVNNGAQVSLDTPTKEGHTFEGWYLDEAFTTPFDETTPITEITELYAKFNINTYTITFTSEGVTVQSINADYGSLIEAPSDPSKEGYNFMGWYIDEVLWQFNSDTIDENMVLTAVFETSTNQFILEEVSRNETQIEIRLKIEGNVRVNAYTIDINYDENDLGYVSHDGTYTNFVNVNEDGMIKIIYSNVLTAIVEPSEILTITFNRLTPNENTLMTLTIGEAYYLTEVYAIVPIEFSIQDLTILP